MPSIDQELDHMEKTFGNNQIEALKKALDEIKAAKEAEKIQKLPLKRPLTDQEKLDFTGYEIAERVPTNLDIVEKLNEVIDKLNEFELD